MKRTFFIGVMVWLCGSAVAQTWRAMPMNLSSGNNTVRTLYVDDDKLYVGGAFWQLMGADTIISISVWNGSYWDSLGPGLRDNFGLTGVVKSIINYKGVVYAGGNVKGGLSKFDGTQWQEVGGGLSGSVNALSTFRDSLYTAGNITSVSSLGPLNDYRHIVRWNGTEFHRLLFAGGLHGNSFPNVSAVLNDRLYVGGGFFYAGEGFTTKQVNKIAVYDGETWQPLGDGMDQNISTTVLALLADTINGNLYAGGSFYYAVNTIGKDSTEKVWGDEGVLRWDGKRWAAEGIEGKDFTSASNGIRCMTFYHGELYISGVFGIYDTAGTVIMNDIARWNGREWKPLGGGIQLGAIALAVYNDTLFAGGAFDTVDATLYSPRLAKWHTPDYCDSVSVNATATKDTVKLLEPVQFYNAGWSNRTKWDFGDGSPIEEPDADTATYAWCTPGTYAVAMEATYGFCQWQQDTVWVTVTGDTAGTPYCGSFNTQIISADTVNTDDTVSFTAQPACYDSRQWDFGDGQGSTAPAPTHGYDTAGYYYVRCITGYQGCTDTTGKWILVQQPTGVAGVPGKQRAALKLYPNPNAGTLQIEYRLPAGLKEATLYVYNISGQLVSQRKLKQGQHKQTIAMDDWANSTYIFTIKDKNGRQLVTGKVVKQ